jgi:ribosomal-protein-alanine N-acetyltransferase
MTVGVLPAYQRQGLGRLLVEHAIAEGQKQAGITEVHLHVREDNAAAQAFYERIGFTRGETLVGYYKSLSDDNAVVVRKELTPASIN